MARDDSKALLRLSFLSILDGTKPSGTLGWVSPATPVVTQAAVGAGHWVSGRPQRALAAWVSAAGFVLIAWGLGTESPTRAEVEENIQQQRDLVHKSDLQPPATAGTETRMASGRSRDTLEVLASSVQMVLGVRSGLRHPRRLTVLAIASETPLAGLYVIRVARAVQRGMPRIVAGSALAAVGSVARLRAAATEPLR